VFNNNSEIKATAEALKSLEAEFRGLKLEWLETYDKINRLYHRLAQRDRYQESKKAAEDTNGGDGSPGPARAIDVVSARILARRRGNAIPHGGGA